MDYTLIMAPMMFFGLLGGLVCLIAVGLRRAGLIPVMRIVRKERE